jgi:hypothetical protein
VRRVELDFLTILLILFTLALCADSSSEERDALATPVVELEDSSSQEEPDGSSPMSSGQPYGSLVPNSCDVSTSRVPAHESGTADSILDREQLTTFMPRRKSQGFTVKQSL